MGKFPQPFGRRGRQVGDPHFSTGGGRQQEEPGRGLAVGHTILIIVSLILLLPQPYQDRGAAYVDQRDNTRWSDGSCSGERVEGMRARCSRERSPADTALFTRVFHRLSSHPVFAWY
jgi:hypothetical protein